MIKKALEPVGVWDAGFAAGMKLGWKQPDFGSIEMNRLWLCGCKSGMKVAYILAGDTSEHGHQSALFTWADEVKTLRPEVRLMFSIPNGGLRAKATAGKLKAEGVKAGVPDVCLPVLRYGSGSLFIEMKAPKGRISDVQGQWLNDLNDVGNTATVCYGFEEARQAVCDYLSGGRDE